MLNKVPVVFTFDKRIVLGGAVAIKSLIDTANSDTLYDIYVYHPDLKGKHIRCFEEMLKGTKHNIKFEHINPSRFKSAPINKDGSWTEIVYYRLLIAELLPQYDKVIYSDVDVLFCKDLTEIYSLDLDGYDFGAVKAEKNTPESEGHKYFPENKNEFIFWSGFLLMNTKRMRGNNFIDRCFEVIEQFNDRLKFFDLDTLNLASDNIRSVGFEYCTLQSVFYLDSLNKSKEYPYIGKVYSDDELVNAKENPAIIHYAGEPGKPWRMKNPYNNYQEYINKIPKELRKYTFRDFRKRLFNKV